MKISLLAAVAAIALIGAAAAEPMPIVDRTVYIGTDDQGDIDTLERMPLTMGLITSGRAVRFANSHGQVPLCGPGRATFLTGQTARNHGVTGNGEPAGGWANFADSGLITVAMQNAGIKTALIGVKLINGFRGSPAELGFDHYELLVSHAGSDRYLEAEFDVNGTIVRDSDAYVPDAIRKRCVAFMQAHQGQRYHLVCNVPGPHSPAIWAQRHNDGCSGVGVPRSPAFNLADVSKEPDFVQDRPLWTDSDIAKKDGNFRDRCRTNLANDELIKAVSDADRTAVKIVHSDNGMGFWKRYTGKLTAIDPGSTSVPLVFIDVPRGGRTHEDMVSSVDIAPTILDLMGVPYPTEHPMDGLSLRPFFESAVGAAEWRSGIGITGIEGAVGGDDEDIDSLPTSECFVTRRWWYCKVFGGGASDGDKVLYDRADDPSLSKNLAYRDGKQDIVEMMNRQAMAYVTCAGDECNVFPSEMKRRKGRR